MVMRMSVTIMKDANITKEETVAKISKSINHVRIKMQRAGITATTKMTM